MVKTETIRSTEVEYFRLLPLLEQVLGTAHVRNEVLLNIRLAHDYGNWEIARGMHGALQRWERTRRRIRRRDSIRPL